jgi:hypothetical protein
MRLAFRLFFPSNISAESVLRALPSFESWLAFTWVPDSRHEVDDAGVTLPEGWPTASFGLTWLTSGSDAVSDVEQAFILTAADSPYSLFLVEATMPGWTLTLRDLFTGRRFRIVDPEISARARLEDILFTAVLTLDGVSTLLGPALYTMPSDARVEVRELRRFHSERLWLTRAELMDLAPEVCDQYREACGDDRVIQLDSLGEVREPLVLRWNLATSFDTAFDALRPLAIGGDHEEVLDIENGPEGEPRVMFTWYEPGSAEARNEGREIGFVYLDDGRLAADVPTPTLAARLIREVTDRLGDAATLLEQRSSAPVRLSPRESSWTVVAER